MKNNILKTLLNILIIISILFVLYNLLIGYFSALLYIIILSIIIIASIFKKKNKELLGIISLFFICFISIISYTTGFLSSSNELFKIIKPNKYGYSFERSFANLQDNQKFKIINNYTDFIDIANQIENSFQQYYDYEINARKMTMDRISSELMIFEENYYALFHKREDEFLQNEFNKISKLKNEIKEDFFKEKNILVITENISDIRALNSEICKVEENENTVNVTINLNNPDNVSFVSYESNVHIVYINKQINNVNIFEINR